MKPPTPRRKISNRSLQIILTLRDLGIIIDLYLFQGMLSGQIGELHFPGIADRRRNRRLTMLARANLIVGGPLPLGPLGAATPGTAAGLGGQWFYQLGPAAVEVIANHLGIAPDDIRRRLRKGSPTARAHALEIAQCFIALRRIATKSKGTFQVLKFHPEAFFSYRLNLSNGTSQEERFRPDAHVLVHLGDIGEEGKESRPRQLFCEVDLGHTSSSEWEKKLRIVGRFCSMVLPKLNHPSKADSTYKADSNEIAPVMPDGDRPLYLILTTTEVRAINLKQIMTRTLGDTLPNRLIATFADLAELAGPPISPTLSEKDASQKQESIPSLALSSAARARRERLAAFLGLSASYLGPHASESSPLSSVPAKPEKD
ncbi:replication-relaxation family protein [Armatimonas sp.]|uniref:replication-relaxation family protein n=1 Tax=Armatimonas sp. TaxID=1872638 RepID=UPI00375185E8